MIYGYARVSTEDQTLDNQLATLTTAGAVKIFSEKESGARADNREQLSRAIAALDKGDVLLVTRLDRLARSILDLLNTLEDVSKRKAGCESAPKWDPFSSPGKHLIPARKFVRDGVPVGADRDPC